MNVRELARPEILALNDYVTVANETSTRIRLDNNESPWPAPGLDDAVHRYPAQPPGNLLERMAQYYGIDASRILPTRGSDDAIDALIRCFCRPGLDAIHVLPPTFTMYATFAGLNGVQVIETPLDSDFGIPEHFPNVSLGNERLVFVCSPNNPTGRAVNPDVISTVCEKYCDRALVVVDEAYSEFMSQPSATALLSAHPNLVVLRTLSKGLALAGARVGALLAQPDIVTLVRRVLPPYLLPSPSVAMAERILSPDALHATWERIRQIHRERERLTVELARLSAVRAVYASDANFLLVDFVDAGSVHARLLESGIRVRAFAETRLQHSLRIGIGTPAENNALLDVLRR